MAAGMPPHPARNKGSRHDSTRRSPPDRALPVAELAGTLPAAAVDAVLRAALLEDAPYGDITSQTLIPADARATAVLAARVPGVFSGGEVFAAAMKLTDAGADVELLVADGAAFAAGTPLAIDGETRTYEGKKRFPVPHALTAEELPGIVQEFVAGSRNAIAAGFDGVELHSANGYLLHEFLAPSANQRDDITGSPANRARFVIEVTRAVVEAVGADRVGIRISPEHNVQGAIERDAADVNETYKVLVDALAPLKLAYLSVLHKEPTSMAKAADPAAMNIATCHGTTVGMEAQAPSANMPKNGPFGLSRTRSAKTDPRPASTASTPTSHQVWRSLTERNTPTATPLSRTNAA